MKKLSLISALFFSSSLAFPWLHPDFNPTKFQNNAKRGLQAIKRDPELVQLIQDLYAQQQKEKEFFFLNFDNSNQACDDDQALGLDKRQTTNCLQHPLPDFYPTNTTGLKRFPEPGYPYQDPKPTDQRGPCPGLNTLANHGYIPRSGIVTLAQTIKASAQLFNMGVDLTTFLAGGSVLAAGDIPTMTYSIGGADARTNSLGIIGGSLGTETGLSGHLRFKEGDASGTRCDFYLCNGDNHNLNPSIFLDLQNAAKQYGGGQYNVPALIQHFAHQYKNSRDKNPYFYFFPPQAPLAIGATYFIAGFFSNGTIGAGGVANEASIASFLGAHFETNGSVTYVPEQIPPQGWYRRGYPLFLTEGADAIITLYNGAAAILRQPLLFGANTGTPGAFTGSFGLSQFGGPGSYGGTTRNGFACALEGAAYGSFISEFSSVLNIAASTLNSIAAVFGSDFSCPVPSGAPPFEATAPTYPGYPKPSPCTLNRQQNHVDQCAPDTNTYGRFNSKSTPYCLNNPKVAAPQSNPYPVPVPYSG